jgi:hypothetical protein
MASHPYQTPSAPIDLARWRNVPNRLIVGGAAVAVIGALLNYIVHHELRQFAFSWLTAYMFCFCLCVGALFLVLAHHLFDAGWSVPIRRINENIATLLFPQMAILFIPVAIFAAPYLYAWMQADPRTDHAVHAKHLLFNKPAFFLSAAVILGALGFIAHGLRKWSVKQDSTGAAECTYAMRKFSYVGIWCFAFLVTLAAILWMKALQHQWFSTMYGVQYFAGSVWTTLATVYVITMVLTRNGVITHVLHKHQFYYIGGLFFAFTVFYAYVSFSQYFIIWNANMPEETFWFRQREQGSWFFISMIIIFGHFFLPFLGLLRIDVKENFKIMVPTAIWAWLMRYVDMSFNIGPVLHPQGFAWKWVWLDLACIAFMVGILAKGFLIRYASAAPYPTRDPRLIEAAGQLVHPATAISGADLDETDFYSDGEPQTSGGHK